MLVFLRRHLAAISGSVVGMLTIGWLGFYGFAWTDYDTEAKSSLDALIGGHVVQALQLAPAYGGSLILRAPFALLPGLWGGGPLAVYRMVSLPCLVVAAAVGVAVVGQMRRLDRSRLACAVLLGLFVANPLTIRAGELGHPEELISGACAVAAVLVASRGRGVWAGVLLGVAIANKEWAIIAVGPVMVALPGGRVRALLAAGAVVAVVLAPLLVAGGGFATRLTATASLNSASPIFQPWQVWWFFGSHGHLIHGLFGVAKPGYRAGVGWAIALSHPLIILISAPLSVLAMRAPRREHGALLLLAVLLLLRLELDVWDTVYYPIPFIFALAAWEGLTHRCPPIGALAATVAAWVVFVWSPVHLTPDQQSLLFLLVAVPATGALLIALYAPDSSARLVRGRSLHTHAALAAR